jgi:gas vesicle protein
MADGYDRFDNEGGGGGGSFVMGLLTGTVLGAGLGMLFAPKAGSELRNQLSEQAGSLANTASEGYRKASEVAGESYRKASETASDWAGRGREVLDKARDAAARGADEAQRYVRDAATVVGSASGPSAASNPPAGSGTSGSSYASGSESTFGGSSESTRGSGSESPKGPSSSGPGPRRS